MYAMDPKITVKSKDKEAWYSLVWSPLTKADKYEVTLRVPSVSGVYELYRMDENKKLNLLTVTQAWYGGLRSQIRAAIDPEATTDPLRRQHIEDKEIWYRFSVCNSLDNMLDVVWFLHTTYFPNDVRVQHSGRYSRVYLNEKAPDKVYWLD